MTYQLRFWQNKQRYGQKQGRTGCWQEWPALGRHIPVTLSAAVLLCLLGIGIGEAVLGKELGHVVLRQGGAVGDAGVVLVVELVRAGHCVEIQASPRLVDNDVT